MPCREDSCHLFTVLGPAGVGKSRLVAEALAGSATARACLSGSCLPYGEGITFWPVLEIVKQMTEHRRRRLAGGGARHDRGRASAASPTLSSSRRASPSSSASPTPLSAVEEGFWGVRHLFEALAQQQPLVVVFDDLNWAEPTLLDLVEHIADWSRDAPILLVAMARPDLLDARPAWGGGKHNATAIFLEPLSGSESEQLVEGLLGGGAVDAGGVRAHPGGCGRQPAVRRGDDLDAHRRRRVCARRTDAGSRPESRAARDPVQHLRCCWRRGSISSAPPSAR